jgi:hypothetical protein
MTGSKHSFWTALTLAAVLAGCHSSPSPKTDTMDDRPSGARLSQAEAIRIAKGMAEMGGTLLSDYMEPTAHYEATKPETAWFLMFDRPEDPRPGDHTWLVFFEGRHNSPGDHFLVYVDDKTGRTRIVGGM